MHAGESGPPRRRWTRGERRELAAYYGVIALLHGLGWGLYLAYAARYPALVGLGFAAYAIGLRHGFGADHIAAVDDTVRYLLQRGRSPLGVGFYFSLGHSSVVFLLALAVAFAAGLVRTRLPDWEHAGHLIGAGISGAFLWLIGVLNLLVLLELLDVWRHARRGRHRHDHLERVLARRGFVGRLLGGGLRGGVDRSWQMYPLGLLFGLGLDTAAEIALLAMTAGAIAGELPAPAVLALPLLFAAGMTAVDTSDGVLMCRAYHWALVHPLRRIYYNLTTTALSIAAALLIGSIELLQVAVELLSLRGAWAGFVAGIDFGRLGYAIAGLFLLGWGLSAALWKQTGAMQAAAGAACEPLR
ncbi:HoxN/HupN/NixA family nickel/cobalt transporter [Solimonas flava]|uniref:HoxN/HupN/NixA family nickel/cobalt transporter n=1 Tax=Solimonas flava TaxID=415849 RepID=UPI0004102466|nr:nickel transporter [Solimonas flava]